MKRIIAISLALLLLLGLCACDPQKDADAFLAEYKVAIAECTDAYQAFLENPSDAQLRQNFEAASEKVNQLDEEAKEIAEAFGDDTEGARRFRDAYLALLEQATAE